MKLVYFAWLRERLGRNEEQIELPDDIRTTGDLISWLKQRDEQFSAVFEHPDIIQVAVDQKLVRDRNASIRGASEIALFPPMTGG